MDNWTDLTTYQFIIFEIILLDFFHSNPLFFLISVYCRKIKQNFSWVRLDFHKFILFVIVTLKLYFGGSDNWSHAIVLFWILYSFFSHYNPLGINWWNISVGISVYIFVKILILFHSCKLISIYKDSIATKKKFENKK